MLLIPYLVAVGIEIGLLRQVRMLRLNRDVVLTFIRTYGPVDSLEALEITLIYLPTYGGEFDSITYVAFPVAKERQLASIELLANVEGVKDVNKDRVTLTVYLR